MIISNYEIGKEIGSGSFGTVNIAEDRKTGEKVAVKCISKNKIQRSNMGAQVKKEITTMKKLNHPNIVAIKEVLMSNSHLYLVLEYAGGGELFTKIATQGKLSEKVAKRYFKQIMEAVKFCHNLYVCHRDIEPENILLDANDNVKIADFGFASIMEPEPGSDNHTSSGDGSNDSSSRLGTIGEETAVDTSTIRPLCDFVPDEPNSTLTRPKNHKFRNLPSKKRQKMSTMCGTTQYMAPEIVSRDSYRGDKADIWSCGIVLFVLVAGYLPFDSHDTEIVIHKIKSGFFKVPPFVSELATDVITKMLTPNPLFRPGARTVLDHAWFSDIVPLKPMSALGSGGGGQAGLPRKKSKLPAHAKKKETSKLVAKEERKHVLHMGLEKANSKVMEILQAHTWMQKKEDGAAPAPAPAPAAASSPEPGAIVKASKMTTTGLAMIQVVLHKQQDDTTTVVEVEVCGKQNMKSGARDINGLIKDIRDAALVKEDS